MKLIGSISKDSEEKVVYGKTGRWPRLTLVERSFSEGLIESPWVKLGEVRYLFLLAILRTQLSSRRYSIPQFTGLDSTRADHQRLDTAQPWGI